MSSPGIQQHAHNTTTTTATQDDNALTFVNHQQQQAPGIIPNQSSPTFTVSSSSPSSSLHSPSLFDYHRQSPLYMASTSIKDEQQQHPAPHHQRLFSYAELLSSQTASPYEHHHFSLHHHQHGGTAHNQHSSNHHHPSENTGLGIHPHARFTTMGNSNSNDSYDNRGPDSNILPPSSLSNNALPPPPQPPMTAALHTPYSPSSPIARPFQQQQQQQQQQRHGSDASLYDGNFGYSYMGNSNSTVLGGGGGARERGVSSSTTRPITPISPLSDHHHHHHHQSKEYYHRPSYPPPSLGSGRPVHDFAPVDYNNHPSSTNSPATAPTKLPPRSRGRRVSNIPTQGVRMFTCQAEGCGKVFKRSEHLKRHIRSIHTMEKPFECPYQSCHKRFSRSDNLNQHIRIHRHSNAGVKTGSTPVATVGGGPGGAFPSTSLKDLSVSSLTNKMPRVTASYWQ